MVGCQTRHVSTLPSTAPADSFPRQHARTRRFSLGEPRGFRIAPDGERIAFLRSTGGADPVTRLWSLDRRVDGTWRERLVADPLVLLAEGDSDLPAAERARRERLREQASGITAFDTDADVTRAVFALGGQLLVSDLLDPTAPTTTLVTQPGGFDPRLSPNGRLVAYVAGRELRVVSADRDDEEISDRALAGEDDPEVSWGSADFIAAEELNRFRGFWWSPDSTRVVAARVDTTRVHRWWIADPAHPDREPTLHRYPAALTPNALVSLAVIDVTAADPSSARVDITWDHHAHPYLVDVRWTDEGLFAVLLDRAQQHQQIVRIDPSTGMLRAVHAERDDTWVELAPGTPVPLTGGALLTTVDGNVAAGVPAGLPDHTDTGAWPDPEGTRALVRVDPDGTRTVLTPPNLQVRRVLGVADGIAHVAVTASRPVEGLAIPPDPGSVHVVRVPVDARGVHVDAITIVDPAGEGVHDATVAGTDRGTVTVLRSADLERPRAVFTVLGPDGSPEHELPNLAEESLVVPRPHRFRAGTRAIPCALFLPSDPAIAGDGFDKLPVLLDPYGGPHAQRVVSSRNAHATSQWFADQGFAVLVADGRGTPAMGPRWEREVRLDLAGPVLDDQVTALHEAAERFPQLDLSRVGIRGWSFGGYLAALAVLRRPEIFHAAVAGAPVTEWRLYDTGYTERYLGIEDGAAYDGSSLLPLAPGLTRPLQIIHGLADDNVVAAHTLQLSSILLAHGRPHEVLPLSGVTHMTPQEEVAENLLRVQVEFLRRHLG